MTTKIVSSIKYIAVLSIVLLSIVACEKDFENVGVGLVDNNIFTTKDTSFNIITYNKNVDSSRVASNSPMLLGVTKNDDFGFLKASIVAQVNLANIRFTDNMSIDAVVLDIPYHATNEAAAGAAPKFRLDSIIGDQEKGFDIKVYRNGTYLNTLNPLNPAEGKKYYSDEEFTRKELLHASSGFKPNKNDTVYIVERKFLDGNPLTVDDRDTIKKEKAFPSIKIQLDTTFFRNNFINQQNSGAFDSNDNFKNYFRGLIIDADGVDGSLMALKMSEASMTMYYSNIVLKDESATTGDLNGDGDTDDKQVPVKTKQTAIFPLNSLNTGIYSRDYTKATSNISTKLSNPNTENGEDRLFIQGAAGSVAVIDILKGIGEDKINEIRANNWLINGANLTLYVENKLDSIPKRLYLYNYDDNTQVLDALTEGASWSISGVLEKGEDNKPLKYKFSITDYISEVLKSGNLVSLKRLAIKVAHPLDYPSYPQSGLSTDTMIRDFSWDARGVILVGNNLTDPDNPMRAKLEIFYTVSDNK